MKNLPFSIIFFLVHIQFTHEKTMCSKNNIY